MMGDLVSFGSWIRRRRRGLDLTQTDLAERVGCAPITIQKIELDERRPSRQMAERLAEALALAPAEREHFFATARGERQVAGLPDAGPTPVVPAQVGQPPAPVLQPLPAAWKTQHTNLQPYLSRFIGRRAELATLRELVTPSATSCRLVTLLGPGGVGKTRLASELGATLQDSFSDGIWLVELAPLFDSAFVLHAIAARIGVREESGVPLLQRIITVLAEKQLLLILDNCEHLIEECAHVAEALLRACPLLTIVATSRETLNIAGETLVEVAPLRLPSTQETLEVEHLQDYEAISLFTDRARSAQREFQLTPDNAAAVVQICQRLDGLPLALELSAARIRTMAPEQMVSRLDQRLRLLVGGSRTAQPRHQTLQALIDWSYTLLSEEERLLFRQLALFAGGWTLEAAEAVCATGSAEPLDVLALTDQLVAKSLIVVEERAERRRYTMLETLREYAQQRLMESGELEALRARHRAYYLRLAESMELALQGPEQRCCLESLELEHENFRAALEWSLAPGAGALEEGLRLVAALREFWFLKNHWSEARQWLDRLLKRADEEQAAGQTSHLSTPCISAAGFFAHLNSEFQLARSQLATGAQRAAAAGDAKGQARALADLAWVDLLQGAYDEALGRLETSAALAQAAEALPLLALVRYRQGFVLYFRDEIDQARACMQQSLELAEQLASISAGVGLALYGLATVAIAQRDFDIARAALERSRAIYEQFGDSNGIGMVWCGLGELARAEGRDDEAASWYSRSLELCRKLGMRRDVAAMQHNLAHVLLHRGHCDLAEAQLAESLALSEQIEEQTRDKALVLAALGGVAAVRGQLRDDRRQSELAACLFGAVQALLDNGGFVFDGVDQLEYERNLALARAQLAPDAFEHARARGQMLTLDQALDLALPGRR